MNKTITQTIRYIRDIVPTHSIRCHQDQDALSVTLQFLSQPVPGIPVVNDQHQFVGFIGELEIIKALDKGQLLSELTVKDILNKSQIAVPDWISIQEALQIMEEENLYFLPVVKEGIVLKSITRNDLLRAKVTSHPMRAI